MLLSRIALGGQTQSLCEFQEWAIALKLCISADVFNTVHLIESEITGILQSLLYGKTCFKTIRPWCVITGSG